MDSGEPSDALLAFRLLARCVRAREASRSSASSAISRGFERRSCGDIGAAQIANRLAIVERAVRAGVPGAVTAWIGEGPFGDRSALDQRPDDPLVVEWIATAIDRVKGAARRDDIEAIMQLALLSLNWDRSDIERAKLLVRLAEAPQNGVAMEPPERASPPTGDAEGRLGS